MLFFDVYSKDYEKDLRIIKEVERIFELNKFFVFLMVK